MEVMTAKSIAEDQLSRVEDSQAALKVNLWCRWYFTAVKQAAGHKNRPYCDTMSLQEAVSKANQQRDDAIEKAQATGLRLHEAQQHTSEVEADRRMLAEKLASLQIEHNLVRRVWHDMTKCL